MSFFGCPNNNNGGGVVESIFYIIIIIIINLLQSIIIFIIIIIIILQNIIIIIIIIINNNNNKKKLLRMRNNRPPPCLPSDVKAYSSYKRTTLDQLEETRLVRGPFLVVNMGVSWAWFVAFAVAWLSVFSSLTSVDAQRKFRVGILLNAKRALGAKVAVELVNLGGSDILTGVQVEYVIQPCSEQ